MDGMTLLYLDISFHNSTKVENDAYCRVEDAGDERTIIEMVPHSSSTRCNDGRWLMLDTGELIEPRLSKSSNRQGCKLASDGTRTEENLRKTMGRIQRLLCANYESEEKTWLITLTFANQVYDLEEARRLFSAFWRRFKRSSEAAQGARYLCVPHPHKNGAWHLHLITFFKMEVPEPRADEIEACWRHGRVDAKRVYDAYGLGCYLNPLAKKPEKHPGKTSSKRDRLDFYPANKQLVWHSKGMKKTSVHYYRKGDCDMTDLLEGYRIRTQYPLVSSDGRVVGKCIKVTKRKPQ